MLKLVAKYCCLVKIALHLGNNKVRFVGFLPYNKLILALWIPK